jgi:hypothetical protein
MLEVMATMLEVMATMLEVMATMLEVMATMLEVMATMLEVQINVKLESQSTALLALPFWLRWVGNRDNPGGRKEKPWASACLRRAFPGLGVS